MSSRRSEECLYLERELASSLAWVGKLSTCYSHTEEERYRLRNVDCELGIIRKRYVASCNPQSSIVNPQLLAPEPLGR